MSHSSITLTEASQKLPELVKTLPSEPMVITQAGKPALVAMSYEHFNSLMETLDLLSDKEFLNQLQLGIKQVNEGETIPLEQAFKELGWDEV